MDLEKDQNSAEQAPEGAEARRDFLKKAATVGMTAPAVAMLLSAEVKAQSLPGYGPPTPAPEPTPAPPP